MNVMQLIAEAKTLDPALTMLPDDDCRDLLLVAFRVVRKALAATQGGELTVGGLGTFQVGAAPADGDAAAAPISFRIAQPPAKKAARKAAAKKAAARKVAPARESAPARKAAAVKTARGAHRPL